MYGIYGQVIGCGASKLPATAPRAASQSTITPSGLGSATCGVVMWRGCACGYGRGDVFTQQRPQPRCKVPFIVRKPEMHPQRTP